MRVAIDMDGVIADVFAGIHCASELVDAMRAPEFFAGLRPIDGALDGLRGLADAHDIIVVSSAMFVPHAFAEKFGWLTRHLPWLGADRIVFCGTKRVVAADILIDDSSYQLQAFPGHGILFASPLNASDSWPRRVEGWAQVAAAVSACAALAQTNDPEPGRDLLARSRY